jgi:DNA-directed RNA polymerase subunit RPC12/RpoP
MALIQCGECSEEISDKAETCPKCGIRRIKKKRRKKAKSGTMVPEKRGCSDQLNFGCGAIVALPFLIWLILKITAE